MTREEKFMQAAVELSGRCLIDNGGGPFGCIVVKNDEIVGRGFNRVISKNDHTAHAEVEAIRDACNHLQTHQLEDCEIYTSCEPCPMCLGAIYWARPAAVYYANSRLDAAAIGFDDSMIYDEFNVPHTHRKIPITQVVLTQAIEVFDAWKAKEDRAKY